ncbi:hypothetical protein EAG_09804 [Camponotus floridanus]|uniref:Uncharacterized protein n=1 Tax=Camponotus floridanus TaxID=104421 RepID=E2AUT3_CAMFO|nr:hypothetical protein EAG_09804 [Camponotus floridanus]
MGRPGSRQGQRRETARVTSSTCLPTQRQGQRRAANHVTRIRCGVRQNCADWASLAPTMGSLSRMSVPRASLA